VAGAEHLAAENCRHTLAREPQASLRLGERCRHRLGERRRPRDGAQRDGGLAAMNGTGAFFHVMAPTLIANILTVTFV
jgi:hypothetical protein